MKNKFIVSFILLLLVSFSSADTVLYYDSAPYSNGALVSDANDFAVRVRFTPSADLIGGVLEEVQVSWCDVCISEPGNFYLVVRDAGNLSVFVNSSVLAPAGYPNVLGDWTYTDVSALGFVVSGDFFVEVYSPDSNLYVFMGGDGSELARSYHFGVPNASSWTSFEVIKATYFSGVEELAIRAVVSPPLDECRWVDGGCVGSCGEGFSCVLVEPEVCMCQSVVTTTTTTLVSRPPSGGGGGVVTGGVGRNCFDDIMNCHHGDCETGIDCGGPCDPCMNCSDGVQNQGETGVDCGGPCPPCPTTTTTTTVSTTTSTVPVVVFPRDCGAGCSRIPSEGNPFSDCVSCVASLDCGGLCGAAGVCDIAEYCYSSGDGSFCGCCCQSTSTTFVPSDVTGQVTGFPLGGVSLFLFFFFLLLLGFGVYRYFRGGGV